LSASLLRFWKGRTAIDSIAAAVLLARRYWLRPIAAITSTTTVATAASLCCWILETKYSALEALFGRLADVVPARAPGAVAGVPSPLVDPAARNSGDPVRSISAESSSLRLRLR